MKVLSFVTCVAISLCCAAAEGGKFISEIYFNPPGSNDAPATNALEYIELCGPADLLLDNHYLIFLENENDEFNSQNPGEIENIFNLSGMSFGSNGFLVLGMRNTAYPALSGPFDIAAPAIPAAPTKAESLKTLANGTHAYINRDTGVGYGAGVTSSLGHIGQNPDIEGSGFTAMLIEVNPALGGLAPVFEDDLDTDNNGLDIATGQTGWTIHDSIGVFGESDEPTFGRLYSPVGFGAGSSDGAPGGFEPGATYISTIEDSPLLSELEYVGRVGGGQSADNWLVANLTNEAASGYNNTDRNYGISGNHALQNTPEAWIGDTPGALPYGTDITVTFGTNSFHTVPEPSSFVLLIVGGVGVALLGRRRRFRD